MLIASFILGLTGSLHCVGMCGPIALLVNAKNRRLLLVNRLLYHSGRTTTYMVMGLLVGLVGKIFQVRELQGVISISIGVIILVVLLTPPIQSFFLSIASAAVLRLRSAFGKVLQARGNFSAFLTGIFNGILPCGLVYAALTFALIQTSPAFSVLSMTLFGLGTIPALLLAAYSWQSIRKLLPWSIQKIQVAMLVVVAVIMIGRGLQSGTGIFHSAGEVLCLD